MMTNEEILNEVKSNFQLEGVSISKEQEDRMSKYYYEFEGDSKYCYPNSDILRSKFDIENPEILSKIEVCYDGFYCRYDKMEDLIRNSRNSIVKISDIDANHYRVLFGTYIEE